MSLDPGATPTPAPTFPSYGRVLRYAAVVVVAALVPVLLWKLSDIVLLVVTR